MLPLTLRQCRDAARAVRGTGDDPAAVRHLRRLDPYPLRTSFALVLYLAAAQGRVVWRSPTAFAVLEPPGRDRGRTGPGRHARWARRFELVWPHVQNYSPLLLVFAAAPFFRFAGYENRLLFSLVAQLVILLYVGTMMFWVLIRAVFLTIRESRARRRGKQTSADRVFERNWSIGLLHIEDPAAAEPLLRSCQERANELAAGTDYSGGVLVCREKAVTTAAGRAAVTAAAIVAAVPGTDEAMVVVRNSGEGPPVPVSAESSNFLVGFFAICVLFLTFAAWGIAYHTPVDGESITYFDALAWLFDQMWLFGDLGTTAPTWPPNRIFGIFAQLLGAMAIVALARAGWLSYRAYQASVSAGERAVERGIDEADTGLVFINHRKGSHRGLVKALRRDLAGRLGTGQVFMDYQSMPLGSRYPDELRDALRRCRVLLAIIHDGWLDDLREPRESLDWVHYEIATALDLGKVVIAVYFDEAPRLNVQDLPADIRELALRQDRRVRWHSGNLDDDLDRLAENVRAVARMRRVRPEQVAD